MRQLPTYNEIKNKLPIFSPEKKFIEDSRQTIRHILEGKDSRLLLIMGPCSIHDIEAAQDYGLLLRDLAQEVKEHFFVVMRTYMEKPRTHSGWKGFLYDPALNGTHDMHHGIYASRELMLKLSQLEIPLATEFLDPLTASYYDDLISWGSIGARTSSSQIHRQLASKLKMPVGFKNGITGNISAAINGILAAIDSQAHILINEHGHLHLEQTSGNKDTHVVLRGGETGPNYFAQNVNETLQNLRSLQLPLRLLIDCSHHNSNRKCTEQKKVFTSVTKQIIEGNKYIRGMMLESHLKAGKQELLITQPHSLEYGVSITDECLDWNSSYNLIHSSFNLLKAKSYLTFIQPPLINKDSIIPA